MITIKLNKPDNTYIAGEILEATINIANVEEEKVRSVYVLVAGDAHVQWDVQESHRDSQGRDSTTTTTYTSHETYLNSQTVLFGSIGGPTVKYPQGHHSYKINVALPDRLPGTVKTSEAEIKYRVKVVMDIPWGIDKKESQVFQVANVVDLNQNQTLKFPVQLDETKSFCLFSCDAQTAVISASVPQGGYTPHETIPIHCTIQNKTKVPFEAIAVELERKVTAICTSPQRRHRESRYTTAKAFLTISQETCNTTTEVTALIKVPKCPVSSHFAAYILTDYVLIVEFRVVGCHTNVTLRIPIEIGSIALGTSNPNYGSTNPIVTPMQATAPLPDNEKDGIAAEEQPPPSYAEVTMMDAKGAATKEGTAIGWNLQ